MAAPAPIAAPVAAPAASNESAWLDATDAADAAAASNDWLVAAARFEEASRLAPDSVESHYKLAVSRAIAGDMVGARNALVRVKELAPTFPAIDDLIARVEPRAQAYLGKSVDVAAAQGTEEERAAEATSLAAERSWLMSLRTLQGLPAQAAVAARRDLAALEGKVADAARLALVAIAQSPSDLPLYARAADALRVAGEIERARYYRQIFVDLGGDPTLVAPVTGALNRLPSDER